MKEGMERGSPATNVTFDAESIARGERRRRGKRGSHGGEEGQPYAPLLPPARGGPGG